MRYIRRLRGLGRKPLRASAHPLRNPSLNAPRSIMNILCASIRSRSLCWEYGRSCAWTVGKLDRSGAPAKPNAGVSANVNFLIFLKFIVLLSLNLSEYVTDLPGAAARAQGLRFSR